METLGERVEALEKKVSMLQGVNLIKEDSEEPMRKEERVFRPIHV